MSLKEEVHFHFPCVSLFRLCYLCFACIFYGPPESGIKLIFILYLPPNCNFKKESYFETILYIGICNMAS